MKKDNTKNKGIVWLILHFVAAHLILGVYTYNFLQTKMEIWGEQNINIFCIIMLTSVIFWTLGLYLISILCKNCPQKTVIRAGNVLLCLFMLTMGMLDLFVYILYYYGTVYAGAIPRPVASLVISSIDVFSFIDSVYILAKYFFGVDLRRIRE